MRWLCLVIEVALRVLNRILPKTLDVSQLVVAPTAKCVGVSGVRISTPALSASVTSISIGLGFSLRGLSWSMTIDGLHLDVSASGIVPEPRLTPS